MSHYKTTTTANSVVNNSTKLIDLLRDEVELLKQEVLILQENNSRLIELRNKREELASRKREYNQQIIWETFANNAAHHSLEIDPSQCNAEEEEDFDSEDGYNDERADFNALRETINTLVYDVLDGYKGKVFYNIE